MNDSEKLAFDAFEFDLPALRLSRSGHRVKLQPKSAAVLHTLISKHGSTVSRSELQKALWPDGTVVDYDLGLNIAIKKLRDALGDSAENPSFIQTIPGEGYRFIASVERITEKDPLRLGSALGDAGGDMEGVPAKSLSNGASAGIQVEATGTLLPGARKSKLATQVAVTLALAIGLISIAWWGWRSTRPAIPFHAHDFVLIANFDNRTGEPTLDGAVETALRRELSNSAYISVASFARIDDTLRLMEKPISTRITPEVAREVCLRDGGIRAILTGRIQKLGNAYEIDVFVTGLTDSMPTYSFTQTASTQSGLLVSIHRLTDAVRRRLGEDTAVVRASGEKLERVTTPSLQALQLYSKGEQAAEQGHWPEAEPLFRAALARDPHFASALAMLAWSIRYQSTAPRGAKEHEELLARTEEAYQLIGSVSNREAGFVTGTYYFFRNDQERAIAAFKAVADAYPDDPWSANLVFRLERYRGNDVEASEWVRRMAGLRPNDPDMVSILWDDAEADGKSEEANTYAKRLNAFRLAGALPAGIATEMAWQPAFRRASVGDVAGALQEANQVIALADDDALDRSAVAGIAANFFTSIGRLSDAEKWAEAVGGPIAKLDTLEYVAANRGDGGVQLVRILKQIHDRQPYSVLQPRFAARDLAYNGRFREARAAFSRVPHSGPPMLFDQVAFDELLDGSIERGEGNLDGATAKLQDSLQRYDVASNRYAVIYVRESLARALDAKGDTAGAIAVLEPLERDPRFGPGGIGPTQARFLLSTLYRKAGRVSDARKVEAELLGFLRFADPDYPLLVALKRQASDEIPHS